MRKRQGFCVEEGALSFGVSGEEVCGVDVSWERQTECVVHSLSFCFLFRLFGYEKKKYSFFKFPHKNGLCY